MVASCLVVSLMDPVARYESIDYATTAVRVCNTDSACSSQSICPPLAELFEESSRAQMRVLPDIVCDLKGSHACMHATCFHFSQLCVRSKRRRSGSGQEVSA